MDDEENKKVTTEDNTRVSPVSEARKILDGIKKEKEELREERKKLEEARAEDLLSGSSGGHIESKQVSPEDQKKVGAKEFFKGTELENAIDKL